MDATAPNSELHERLGERWKSLSLALRSPIGQAGFGLPPTSALLWSQMPGGGEDNWILSDSGTLHQYSYDVGPDCKNNVLVLGEGTKCQGRIYLRGSNNVAIVIGSQAAASPVNVHFHSSNHLFFFGKDSTSNTATFEMGTDGTSIVVGEDCMFSAFIDVTTDDHHAVVDLLTGTHLNPARDILIEPHVWIGMHCMILKGVKIGFGSIVGARSVVTREIPRKVAVVGSPATIKRSNVSWTRDRRPGPRAVQDVLDVERRIGPEQWGRNNDEKLPLLKSCSLDERLGDY